MIMKSNLEQNKFKSLKGYINDYQKIIVNIKLHNEAKFDFANENFNNFKNDYDFCECDIEKIVSCSEEPQTMRFFLLISNILNLYVKKVIPEFYENFLKEFKVPRIKSHTKHLYEGDLLLISFPFHHKDDEPVFKKYDYETFRISCTYDFEIWLNKHKLNFDNEINRILTKYSSFQSNTFYALLDKLSKDKEHKLSLNRNN